LSLAHIYDEAMNILSDKHKKLYPNETVTEEEVERKEQFIFSLLSPWDKLEKKFFDIQHKLERKREMLLQDITAYKQIRTGMIITRPSLVDRAKHEMQTEKYLEYTRKIEENLKKPPPGQTHVYPYSFYPPGYQPPTMSELSPYNKLNTQDSTSTSSFQINKEANESIWSKFKYSISSIFLNSTSTPLSYTQSLEHQALNSQPEPKYTSSTTETALVPVTPEEDAPHFWDIKNPRYSTFHKEDFDPRHRDIKVLQMKDVNPELSKNNLKLEIVFGLYPKFLKVLYNGVNPIDMVKYMDVHVCNYIIYLYIY
jgi:hypothetical protein